MTKLISKLMIKYQKILTEKLIKQEQEPSQFDNILAELILYWPNWKWCTFFDLAKNMVEGDNEKIN